MSQMTAWLTRFPLFVRLGQWPKPVWMGAAAALVALAVVAMLWLRGPEYRVLFANLEDRDGGAIVAALAQLNVPYQFSDNGAAILVPADKVHATRLQLAEQGLPKTGQVGFELFDNTRFGASQFSEQVTYQRSLEGELGTSIEALHSVQKARVHLAIPRETLFVRERRAPTASVLLTLYPGRVLNQNQVAAITWLVSSSVPGLSSEDISVVDQNGHLLTASSDAANADQLQRRLTHEVEQRAVNRIMTLLTPLLGTGNVRAQVSADMDFAQHEETSEVYRPNQKPGEAAIRSQQTSDARQHNAPGAQGVPGALSNQPPAEPVAPIDTPATTSSADAQGAVNTRHEGTINYEVDRTIRHTKAPVGRIQRLSAAVLVNYRASDTGEPQALSDADMQNIQDLVRQAMGFDAARGDTFSVVNSPFSDGDAAPPWWKDEEIRAMALTLGKYLLIALLLLMVWRKVGKPVMDKVLPGAPAQPDAADASSATEAAEDAAHRYEDNLDRARDIAKKDPAAVAMVIRMWMEKDAR